jgi:zinc protease
MVKFKNNFVFSVLFLFLNTSIICGQSKASKFTFVKELGGIQEYLFEPNGLSVLLVQDNSTPVVTVQVTYRVGSKHEVSGNTGSTHLLEHLLFKGTPKYNRETISITNALQNVGARMNATTWYDRTNYFETIPSDKIDLALDIEADRMRNSLLKAEDKAAEMTVVRNEFERGENNPSTLLSKEVWSTAFMAHTYHHSTIGWRSDVENVPNEKIVAFYNTYYWPNNATLSIIGDFNKETIFALIDKYFGVISKAPHQFPQPFTEEPEQFGPRKIVIKKPGQRGIVTVSFKSPGKLHEDHSALSLLSDVIKSGASSILNKTFIDSGLGIVAYSNLTNFKEQNLFTVEVGLSPKATHDEVNSKIIEIISKIKENGISQEDLTRVIAKSEANDILNRDGSFAIAEMLNESIAYGDWSDYINGIAKIKKVTIEDVKRVANKYLLEDQSTTGYFIPVMDTDKKKENSSSSSKNEDGKVFFRNPEIYELDNLKNDVFNNLKESAEKPISVGPKLNYNRKTVSGIDITTVKTAAKGFITVVGSLDAGTSYSTENRVIANLTADMLLKGTKNKDKYVLSQSLDLLGTKININAGTHKTTFSFMCLSDNANKVVALLAEVLRQPNFDPKELEILKKQYIGNIQNNLDNAAVLANIKLSQIIYPQGHPSYKDNIETQIEKIKKVTLKDINQFYENHYGTKGMNLVIVGDLNKNVISTFGKPFEGWKGGLASKKTSLKGQAIVKTQTEIITVKGKPSAELLIAQYTGLSKNNPDLIPFQLATFTLGGGFSGRLMQTVRDVDGLTYSIGASHSSDEFSDGYFLVNASFNPGLLKKGEDATLVQINNWIKDGISEKELINKKTNIIGSFKVSLSTSRGLANSILSTINQGKEPSYIDQYPIDVNAVSLDKVNALIKKHINPDAFVILKAGSIDESGNPLKK